ncbi:aryl-alcohol dehydrogenase-like predicted oxidoreductase [Sinorhizobium terangae]|uniref:Aldo/keto reductase n=1 Tax=Sinorhizobium terangae TaxID=110322 RepID=A0A6N7LFN2_SINTE|nr:aldo/keto reductase [Sinorhizobium terangae]MBB4186421.1 aryl-alcohol dehydrogenase-like predicted oxidoreductase [Sinorhizobium terangae]MQX16028.1 aldo/keto reductase [Sinorhizobium terangae]
MLASDISAASRRPLGRSGLSAAPIGLGCWAIGGHFTLNGKPDGWGEIDDEQSIRAIHLGLEMGASLIDTADAYGTGHSEEVIGRALRGRRGDAIIATKFGYTHDRAARALVGTDVSPAYIERACAASRERLATDHIDLYQIHVGELRDDQADAAGETLERLAEKGAIRFWGWSTDNAAAAKRMVKFPHFVAVQQELNVFIDGPEMLAMCEGNNLASLNRSPLAMGFLTGKFGPQMRLPPSDVRAAGHSWVRFFEDGRPRADYLDRLARVRELLKSGGRTLAQGALGWILARSPSTFPIPGFKTEAQVRENLAALEKGPLPEATVAEIKTLLANDAGHR